MMRLAKDESSSSCIMMTGDMHSSLSLSSYDNHIMLWVVHMHINIWHHYLQHPVLPAAAVLPAGFNSSLPPAPAFGAAPAAPAFSLYHYIAYRDQISYYGSYQLYHYHIITIILMLHDIV